MAKILQTHPDAEQRAQAVVELGAMRNGRAYEAIGIAVYDKSAIVRKAIEQAFEKIGANWVSAPVLIRLRSNDAGARMVACQELGRLGDCEAVLPLIDRLDDANFQVRVAAAYALGQLGDPRAIKPLQQLMRRALNPSLRQTIQRSLSLLLQKK
ncbi:MAG: HEAT repeat domain-containing protein [Candidatus Thorarchaeota archaeon]